MLKWQTTPSPRNSFIWKDKSATSLETFYFSYELSDVEKLMQNPADYSSVENIDEADEEEEGILTSSPNENYGTRENNGDFPSFEIDDRFDWLEDSFERSFERSLTACTIVNCIHMTNGSAEVHHWMQNVTGSYIPKREFFRLLKDGDILRQFITLIVGENCYAKFKRIRRSLPWRCLDNITYFLKECKKFGLHNEQLFTTADLHYVARTSENCFYEHEWNLRLRKVLMTFFWLASRLREQKKYEKHLRDVSIESLCTLTTNGQHRSLSKEENLNNEMAITPGFSQDAMLFKNQRRVTFHEHVMQHCCSVENIGKPFFHVDRTESPPDYCEYIKMIEDSTAEPSQVSPTSADTTTSYVTFTPKSYLFADSEVLKDANNNDKNKHSPRSQRFKSFKLNGLSPKLKRFHPGKASKIRIPSSSSTAGDEGYATSSQNGGTPNMISPEVAQTITEEKQDTTERSKYKTLPARYEREAYKKQFDFNELSLKKNETRSDKIQTTSLPENHAQLESTPREKKSDEFVSLKGYHTLQRSNTYSQKQNTLTRREIHDLNALLDVFGDKIESGSASTDEEDEKRLVQQSNALKKSEQLTVFDCKENRSDGTNTAKDQRKLCYDLENVVNELLSLGDNNKSDIRLNEQNLSHSISKTDIKTAYDENIPDFDAIEQALALNQIFIDSSIEDNVNENLSEEGNDSGIDETMPGLMREEKSQNSNERKSNHKRNDDPKKHKYGADKKERKKKDDKQRSGSGERKSKTSERNGNAERSSSVPRNDRHKSGQSHHDSNILVRTGRSKERRSEPSNTTSKVKLEKRRSEPVVTNKIRNENDIDGGAVGEYRRRNTDGKIHRKKEHKHENKNTSKKHEPKVVIPTSKNFSKQQSAEIKLKPDKNAWLKRNNSVHLNPSSNEYMWDTADGKHRVYMRSGNISEDPGPLPKKEMLNLDANFQAVNTDRELIKELGVTPEMIRLLQEEEKFWQKQQELRQWRESRDAKSHSNNINASKHYGDYNSTNRQRGSRSPDGRSQYQDQDWKPNINERNYSDASRYSGHHGDHRVHREAPGYNQATKDLKREADEERMAREAERLMRIRAEQEHVLKTSRENLLRDEDGPKSFGGYDNYTKQDFDMNSPNRQSVSPDRIQRRESHRIHKPNVRDPDVIERNYMLHRPGNETEADFPPFRLSDRNRQNNNFKPSYKIEPTDDSDAVGAFSLAATKPPVSNTRTSSSGRKHNGRAYVCFSDDDEVFQESRRQDETTKGPDDLRGYFSDDGIRDVGIDKTYLARPLMRDRKTQLRCTACCKIISDDRMMHVEGQNIYWHSKCFLCTVCRAYLNDKHAIRVRIVHYKLHCRFCYSAQNGEQLSEV